MNFLLLLLSLGSTSIDDYIVSVGDTLLITVYGGVSFSYQQGVTSSGEIFIQHVPSPSAEEAPFIAWEVLDVVDVAGIDLKTVTKIVEDRFTKYFRDVRVNLSVVSFSARIYVTGAVVEPGARAYNPDLSGLDYIGLSGGPSERANMKKAYIRTREGEKLPITDSPPRYSAVMVPEIGIMWWQDYLTIASAVTGIIITWLTITR
ncbi:hypothetical protein LR066_00810 [candidate division WOR-3 bacterium]|nr:hypothetical protein [candidate division WOR-3 bacterium]